VTGRTRRLEDAELARDYREALARAAVAARQAALIEHLLAARGLAGLKGEEAAEVDAMLLDAGRRSLEAREDAPLLAN